MKRRSFFRSALAAVAAAVCQPWSFFKSTRPSATRKRISLTSVRYTVFVGDPKHSIFIENISDQHEWTMFDGNGNPIKLTQRPDGRWVPL